MKHQVLLFLRANRRSVAELVGASLLVNMFVLALPAYSMLVYDKAVGNAIHETLWALTIGIGLVLLLELCIRLVRVLILEHTGARWDAVLDDRLMRGVLATPASKAMPVGDVLTRYRELAATRDVLSAQMLVPIVDLPFALIFALAILAIAGPLVLVPLTAAALIFAVAYALSTMAMERIRVANQAHGQKVTALADALACRESLTSARSAQAVVSAFRAPSVLGARASARARLWSQISYQVVPVGVAATTVALMVGGVFRIEAQLLSVGGLISTTLLGGRLVAAVCGIVPVVMRWKEFRRALADLSKTVDLDALVLVEQTAVHEAFRIEGVRCDAVCFAWPSENAAVRPTLNDVSAGLSPGEIVALVGNSGAGKSSLLKLLAGRLAITSGALVYAGRRIDSDDARRWLASQVTYKPQEPVFFAGTVRDIVAAGRPQASDAEVIAALRAAGLMGALDRGELGLNTVVGTNGLGVSGGQRQMLALARALCADAPLMLLDEPTLGLDRIAQESLLRQFAEWRAAGKCVVIASHSGELIQQADRVIVLEGGRLVADAAPAKVLAGGKRTPMTPVTPASASAGAGAAGATT